MTVKNNCQSPLLKSKCSNLGHCIECASLIYEFLQVNSNNSLLLKHVTSLFEPGLHTLSIVIFVMNVDTCNVNIFNLSLLNKGFIKYH